MKSPSVSGKLWKALILVLTILSTILIVADVGSTWQRLGTGQAATLGISIKPGLFRGTYSIPLMNLSASSPLRAAGAAAGDVIVFDRYQDSRRRFDLGDVVGLTVIHGGKSKHIDVVAVPSTDTAAFRWNYWTDLGAKILGLFFGVVVIFNGPESKAYRALAASFAFSGFNLVMSGIAQPGLHALALFMWYATLPLEGYFLTRFAFHFAEERSTASSNKTAARWILPPLGAFTMALVAYGAWFGLGHDAPRIGDLNTFQQILTAVLSLYGLWTGCRSSVGDSRQRQLWLLAIYLFVTLVQLAGFLEATFFYDLTGTIGGVSVSLLLQSFADVLWKVVLLYALLHHRIFNFGFAVNRALFYSVLSLLMLVTFGIIEGLSEHFLHFEGRHTSAFIDSVIALAVYLVFHRVRHSVDHWMESVFFGKWHQNEAALRRFVGLAAHITTADALLRELQAELLRFSGGAPCAVFIADAQGQYARVAGSDHFAESIDANDLVCVRLRASPEPVLMSELRGDARPEVALPMSLRSDLQGIVLMGSKPTGETYRPDEVQALAFALHQVGLDLRTLHAEDFARDNERQRIQIAELRSMVLACTSAVSPMS